jgi:hypothetical protein
MRRVFCVVAAFVALAGCSSHPSLEEGLVEEMKLATEARKTLDDFHAAAAAADFSRYFGHFAENGVFLGTDATERWTVEEFKAYAKPHFDKGKGWTYHASVRHVDVDPGHRYAWFDEALENEKLGPCRGSGVLTRVGSEWKIVQYNLTIPIPNDLALEFAEKIRASSKK